MNTKDIQLPKYRIHIEEQSLQAATATYFIGDTAVAEVNLTDSPPQGWTADAEWLSTPASAREAQAHDTWERINENQIAMAARFHPISHSAFEILVTYFSGRHRRAEERAARHPASKRGDKSK